MADCSCAKQENMNFADKFEYVILTRKKKQDSDGLCMLLTDKSGINENGFGI